MPIDFWGCGGDELAADSPSDAATTARRGGSTCIACSRDARISLNRHIDVAEGYANNMRLYEATGVGALLLTDAAPNLGELFEPGRRSSTYDGAGRARRARSSTTSRTRTSGAAIAAAGQRAHARRAHIRAAASRELVEILSGTLD